MFLFTIPPLAALTGTETLNWRTVIKHCIRLLRDIIERQTFAIKDLVKYAVLIKPGGSIITHNLWHNQVLKAFRDGMTFLNATLETNELTNENALFTFASKRDWTELIIQPFNFTLCSRITTLLRRTRNRWPIGVVLPAITLHQQDAQDRLLNGNCVVKWRRSN